jgi:hypothetical protein
MTMQFNELQFNELAAQLALSEANVAAAEAKLKMAQFKATQGMMPEAKKPETKQAKTTTKEGYTPMSKLLATAAAGGGGGAAAAAPQHQERSNHIVMSCNGPCGKEVSMPPYAANRIKASIRAGKFTEFICNECTPQKKAVACTNSKCDVIIYMNEQSYQYKMEQLATFGLDIEKDFQCKDCLYSNKEDKEGYQMVGKGKDKAKGKDKEGKKAINFHRPPLLEERLSRDEFMRDVKKGTVEALKSGLPGVPGHFYNLSKCPPMEDGKDFPDDARLKDIVASFKGKIFIHKSPYHTKETPHPEQYISSITEEEFKAKQVEFYKAKQAAEAAAQEDEEDEEDEDEGEEEDEDDEGEGEEEETA